MGTNEQTHTKADRTGWDAGPWDGEPDRAEWRDEKTGLPCLAVRHPRSGHWCGYVAVTKAHPYHGKIYSDRVDGKPRDEDYADFDATIDAVLRVHGGITYADKCAGEICHVPAPGEPDDVWWLGFDMAHSGDYQPQNARFAKDRGGECFRKSPHEEYRTLDYVRSECASLAEQLAAVKP